MLRRVSSALGVVIAATGLTAGCGSKPVVGVILPSTGPAASYGESIESGIRLALSDARTREEVPAGFEVVWADSGSEPARAVAELRRMVADSGVKLVIGAATSGEALAMIPVLDELGVVCLSPSASAPGLAQKSRNFFRIYPSDELEGHTAGTFLYERLGQPRIVVFRGDADYARGIEPEFLKQFQEALGGEVAAAIDVSSAGWQQRADVALAAGGVGAAYAVGYAPEILQVVRYLRERSFAGRIVTTSTFYSGDAIREAGAAAEGVMFPLPPFDRTSEKEPVLSFVNRYMETYQRAPDVFAAHGYDAMGFTLQVFTIAKPPETSEILKAISYGGEYNGVTGPILFDENGDVKHYPKMFLVSGGQVLSYQRYLETERKRILNQVQDLLAAPQAR
jgi:branched-chain amino acid transport system substrate-binding protein